MRIILILIFIISLNLNSFGQEIIVSQIENVNSVNEGSFFFPQFSPDGSNLFFTSGNYQGLWKYNFNENKIIQINNYFGSGLSPIFTLDGSSIIFRKDEYIKRRKYSSIVYFNLNSKTENVLENQNRNLTKPILSSHGDIVFKKKSNIIAYDLELKNRINTPAGKFVYVENSYLVLYEDGNRHELSNLEPGNYLWTSLSPDNSKLLFTKAGEGTSISDLNGNILTDLGYANAPVWSPDGNWIAYMVDKDNGYYYTASDIYVVSSDGEKKYQLTDTEYNIEMYPQWSPDGNKIVFHTTNGIIKILQLEVE